MFKSTATAESLSEGDERVAEPCGKSFSLTKDQVEHWQRLSVCGPGMFIKMKVRKDKFCSSAPSFRLDSVIDGVTDLYCHSSAADSNLHAYITLYVLGWMATTCMNSAWGWCPWVCVSLITFTRRCSSRLPASEPSRYHFKGSGCG